MRKEVVRHLESPAVDATQGTSSSLRPADIEDIMGKPIYTRDIYENNNTAGVVTGLAWTPVGGEILFIESSLNASSGNNFTLTGNIGNVMRESATIAFQYVKAHADELGIPTAVFDQWKLHVHVPEGSTPKDGPSAGITLATSIASVFTQRKVRKRLAMSGEITLRGKVLPVGGLKEKILAAKRAGIKRDHSLQNQRAQHRRDPRALHQRPHFPLRRYGRRSLGHRIARRKGVPSSRSHSSSKDNHPGS